MARVLGPGGIWGGRDGGVQGGLLASAGGRLLHSRLGTCTKVLGVGKLCNSRRVLSQAFRWTNRPCPVSRPSKALLEAAWALDCQHLAVALHVHLIQIPTFAGLMHAFRRQTGALHPRSMATQQCCAPGCCWAVR